MATPPRNTQRDHQKASSQSNAKRWGLYLAIALVVLLVLLWLFGDVFTDDSAMQEEPAVQTTAPETSPDTTDQASPPPATVPEPETDTTTPADPDPATDGAEEQDEVIEIEGEADVEIIDES